MTYSLVTGDLAVTMTGLPAGVEAEVVLTGPEGFSQSLTGADTLIGLPIGTYSVALPRSRPGGCAVAGSEPGGRRRWHRHAEYRLWPVEHV